MCVVIYILPVSFFGVEHNHIFPLRVFFPLVFVLLVVAVFGGSSGSDNTDRSEQTQLCLSGTVWLISFAVISMCILQRLHSACKNSVSVYFCTQHA